MIKTLEFYSGIGGLHLALQRSGIPATVIEAYDWVPAGSEVYTENFGKGIVRRIDISQLTASILAPLHSQLWLLSPACQPYTILNPNAKGAADPRAKSFLHLVDNVLPELKKTGNAPRWILIENVAGFETSTTRQTLSSTLHYLGYTTLELLLTPLQFGIPNSRLRYYLLAKIAPLAFANMSDKDSAIVCRSIPGHGQEWADPRLDHPDHVPRLNVNTLAVYLDPPSSALDFYAIPAKTLSKKGVLFDIVKPNGRRTCCFTRGYTHMVEGTSILQMNEDMDTSTTFNAYAEAVQSLKSLATNSSGDSREFTPHAKGEDEDPITILAPLRLRYFTPEELLRLFYFNPPSKHDIIMHGNSSSHQQRPATPNQPPTPSTSANFHFPATISTKTKYRLIGNSVNVEVVTLLIRYLFEGDDASNTA